MASQDALTHSSCSSHSITAHRQPAWNVSSATGLLSILLLSAFLANPRVLCICSHTHPQMIRQRPSVLSPTFPPFMAPSQALPSQVCYLFLEALLPTVTPPSATSVSHPHPLLTTTLEELMAPSNRLLPQTHIPHSDAPSPSDPRPRPGSAYPFRLPSFDLSLLSDSRPSLGSSSSFRSRSPPLDGPSPSDPLPPPESDSPVTPSPLSGSLLTWRRLAAPSRVCCTKGLGTGGGKKDAWRGTMGGRSPAFPTPAPGTEAATAAASAHLFMAEPGVRPNPSDLLRARQPAPPPRLSGTHRGAGDLCAGAKVT